MIRQIALQFGIALLLALLLVGLVFLISPVISDLQMGPASDGFASGSAWIDADGNRVRDADEVPLEGACLWAAATPQDFKFNPLICQSARNLTDSEGNWEGQFFPGLGSGSPIFVFAQPPQGYAPTTDLVVKAANPSFGFASSESSTGDYDLLRGGLVDGEIAASNRHDLIARISFILAIVFLGVGLWVASGRILARLEQGGLA